MTQIGCVNKNRWKLSHLDRINLKNAHVARWKSDPKLSNLDTGKEIRTLQEHNDWVWSVSLSPDGQTLASGSDDNTIEL